MGYPVQLDIDSVKAICGENPSLIVGYGSSLDGYEDVLTLLRQNGFEAKNYTAYRQLSERLVVVIEPDKTQKRVCKHALVNFVWENYKRIARGEEPLTLLFIVGSTNNPNKLTSELITTKVGEITDFLGGERIKINKVITHAELRRATKLCLGEGVSKEMQAAALATIKCVTTDTGGEKLRFIPAEAPWLAPDFQPMWEARKANRDQNVRPEDWRKQLAEKEADFKLERQIVVEEDGRLSAEV